MKINSVPARSLKNATASPLSGHLLRTDFCNNPVRHHGVPRQARGMSSLMSYMYISLSLCLACLAQPPGLTSRSFKTTTEILVTYIYPTDWDQSWDNMVRIINTFQQWVKTGVITFFFLTSTSNAKSYNQASGCSLCCCCFSANTFLLCMSKY